MSIFDFLPAVPGPHPSHRCHREHGSWQFRSWEHLIRDERDWRAHLDYC